MASNAAARTTAGLIDADVHNSLTSHSALKKYLAPRWHREYEHESSRPGTSPFWHGWGIPGGNRVDSAPRSGGPPGSDLDFMREQLLDPWQLGFAILNPLQNFYTGRASLGSPTRQPSTTGAPQNG